MLVLEVVELGACVVWGGVAKGGVAEGSGLAWGECDGVLEMQPAVRCAPMKRRYSWLAAACFIMCM